MTVRSFSLRQNPAYRPGGSHLMVLVAAAALAAGGCSRAIPRQAIPPAAEPALAPTTPVPTSWALSRSLLAQEFEIEQTASVVTTTDTSVFTDSTGLTVAATVRKTTDGGVAGLIRTLTVGVPGTVGSALPGLSFPLAFAAPPIPVGAQYSPVSRPFSADPCQSTAPVALSVLGDLLFIAPDTVRLGATWSDSGRYVTCRDGARLTVSTTRTFVVRGVVQRDGRNLLLIQRTQRAALDGSVVRGDDTTRVAGTGTGSMDLSLDAASGVLVGAQGTSVLEVRVRSRLRSERARQELRSSIRSRTP